MAFSISQNEVAAQVAAVTDRPLTPADRRELISLIDLTSLNDGDTEASIAAFCPRALTPLGPVAAVCVYPRFVTQAAALLKDSGVKLATVSNFPQGQGSLDEVLREIEGSLRDGADEIDVVFPYQTYLRGERATAIHFVARCKEQCAEIPLKVILETGAFPDAHRITQAAEDVLHAGADFIKTSTGKIPQGASLEAAAAMLLAIKKAAADLKRPLGFKAAGGIREPQQALSYLLLAKNILGPEWPRPQTFRLGASQLLDKLIA